MIHWGMIGCGNVTEHKSGPAYQQTSGFNLAAVSARTPGKAKNYAFRHQVSRFYLDAESLINDPDVDAIYIATPPDSHLELALLVAAAGKICCIEKPMALNAQQCDQILHAFQRRNQPLFVAYYRRSLPGFIAIKRAMESGEIGRIRHINWQYTRPPSDIDLAKQPNWRTEKHIARGGYFDDLASHGLDIMTFFNGPVTQANGFGCNQQGLYSADDAVVASLLFANGTTATGSWNFASALRQDHMQILGSKGSIELSVFGDEAAVVNTEQGQYQIDMTKPKPIQGHFVADMAKHLTTDFEHPSQGASARHTSWIIDSIFGEN